MKFTAHAYVARGGAAALPEVLALLEKEGRALGNPDLYARAYARFGIDEARELRDRAAMRAVSGERRVFVIAAASLTAEAQSALLKTFEEPPADALFILLMPSPETLLPTLRSRMQSFSTRGAAQADSPIPAEAFLSAQPERRIEMLKILLDAEERDLGGVIAFLSALERALAPRVREREVADGLQAVYRARSFAADKGSLLKPLLEQAALLLPRVWYTFCHEKEGSPKTA